ncbi:hypothetical protein EYF80_022728 [Liparis tanakae]|uniref:Uncharacterized protein n=1 Tax=Liparis tanakae TaxID=230148 RepID=A0A4Z2HQM3_9TELE|nr:hypothetical protein EYF80_022728 [Liparis tanakae]
MGASVEVWLIRTPPVVEVRRCYCDSTKGLSDAPPCRRVRYTGTRTQSVSTPTGERGARQCVCYYVKIDYINR